jgi:hypothetical protein
MKAGCKNPSAGACGHPQPEVVLQEDRVGVNYITQYRRTAVNYITHYLGTAVNYITHYRD